MKLKDGCRDYMKSKTFLSSAVNGILTLCDMCKLLLTQRQNRLPFQDGILHKMHHLDDRTILLKTMSTTVNIIDKAVPLFFENENLLFTMMSIYYVHFQSQFNSMAN